MTPTLTGRTAVTLFCGRADQRAVVTSLEMHGLTLESRAPDSYEARGPSGSMTLTLGTVAPGSKFAHIVLGAYNAVDNAPGEESAKSKVIDLLEDCQLIVGVRFSPALDDENDERLSGILEAARRTEGLLFDGFAFLDSDLTPLVQVA